MLYILTHFFSPDPGMFFSCRFVSSALSLSFLLHFDSAGTGVPPEPGPGGSRGCLLTVPGGSPLCGGRSPGGGVLPGGGSLGVVGRCPGVAGLRAPGWALGAGRPAVLPERRSPLFPPFPLGKFCCCCCLLSRGWGVIFFFFLLPPTAAALQPVEIRRPPIR